MKDFQGMPDDGLAERLNADMLALVEQCEALAKALEPFAELLWEEDVKQWQLREDSPITVGLGGWRTPTFGRKLVNGEWQSLTVADLARARDTLKAWRLMWHAGAPPTAAETAS